MLDQSLLLFYSRIFLSICFLLPSQYEAAKGNARRKQNNLLYIDYMHFLLKAMYKSQPFVS